MSSVPLPILCSIPRFWKTRDRPEFGHLDFPLRTEWYGKDHDRDSAGAGALGRSGVGTAMPWKSMARSFASMIRNVHPKSMTRFRRVVMRVGCSAIGRR